MADSDSLRQHVLDLLRGRNAHADFDAVVADFPARLRGVIPAGAAHSAWQLLEHMRIAQWDILEFSRDAKHKSPPWPEGYWPKTAAPASADAWEKSVKAVEEHVDAMRKLVADPSRDLFAPLPHGTGQTLLREALLAADHNAYHLGQLVLVRRALGA